MAPAPPCKASAASTASGRIAVQYFRMWIAAVLAVAGVQRLVSAGLSLDVDVGSGRFNLSVDGTSWLPGGGAATVRGAALGLQRWSRGTGIDAHGAFDAVSLLWGPPGATAPLLNTTFAAYAGEELLLFTQSFPSGLPAAPPPPPPPPPSCGAGLPHTDQTGGALIRTSPLRTHAACCAECLAELQCDVWVATMNASEPQECFLVSGHRGFEQRPDRTTGRVRGRPAVPTLLAPFPALSTVATAPLGYVTWGGCQVSESVSGPAWDGSQSAFDGITSGEPLVLHTHTAGGAAARAVAIAPTGNFFVAGQAIAEGRTLGCGIRSSVARLPPGFAHTTALVGGVGINSTLHTLGDLLLGIGGKRRVDPYRSSFVLSHAGYWTDNGAFYYHNHGTFPNGEVALKAVKADLAERRIPNRYMQLDDWWFESEGDVPGMLSWVPKPTEFPSGFPTWLDVPLSMYAPMYSAANVRRRPARRRPASADAPDSAGVDGRPALRVEGGFAEPPLRHPPRPGVLRRFVRQRNPRDHHVRAGCDARPPRDPLAPR